jgi:hypothetical protein
MVIMFRVNPKTWMKAKVAMTDVGRATALISVLRTLLRKTKMIDASPAPAKRHLDVFNRPPDNSTGQVMSSFMPCGGWVAATAADPLRDRDGFSLIGASDPTRSSIEPRD